MKTTNRTAQQIINESETESEAVQLFYPEFCEQKQADSNITKILKQMKGDNK